MKLTTKNIKTLSKNINKKLKEMSGEMKHSEILNLISNSFGYKSYNAFKNTLDNYSKDNNGLDKNTSINLPKVHLCYGSCGTRRTTRLINSYSLNSESKDTFIFNEIDVRDFIRLTKKINSFDKFKRYDSIYIDDINNFHGTLDWFKLKIDMKMFLNCKDIYIVVNGISSDRAIKRIELLDLFDKETFKSLFNKNNVELF